LPPLAASLKTTGHMIKSRLNIFSLGFVFIATILFLTFDILLIVQKLSDIQIFSMSLSDFKESLFIMTWMSVFCIIVIINILIKLKSVIIDNQSKKIIIRNKLTGYERQYYFKELNGFLNSSWGTTEKGNRSIFLIKNNVKVEKISEFTIRNFEEILHGLISIENLGYDKSSFIERIKNTFRYK